MAVLELSCSSSPHLLEAGLGRTQLTQLRLARPIMLTSGVSDWLWNMAVHRKPLTWSYHMVPHKSLENASFSHLHPEMLEEHTDNSASFLSAGALSDFKIYCQIRKRWHTPGLDMDKSGKTAFVFPNGSLTADTYTVPTHQRMYQLTKHCHPK